MSDFKVLTNKDFADMGARPSDDGSVLHLRGGGVLASPEPPRPFDGVSDKLTFAQLAAVNAVSYINKIGDIERDPHLSDAGKLAKTMPEHLSAARAAALAVMQVEEAEKAAKDELGTFYAAPALLPNDVTGSMIDAEARQWIRGMSVKDRESLAAALDSGDPKMERLVLGLVRSPLPIVTLGEKAIDAAWRALCERRDPDRLGRLQARVDLAEWARIVTHQAATLIAGRIAGEQKRVAAVNSKAAIEHRRKVFDAIDTDNLIRGYLHLFGFQPMEIDTLRRLRAA